MAHQGLFPDVLLIDRAYLNSELTKDVLASGGDIVCRPWRGAGAKPGLFGKRDFKVNVGDGTITCPAGEVEPFEPGAVVHFNPEACGPCKLRSSCAQAATGKGRKHLRERVDVEHRLANLANRQSPKARSMGTRRNVFDLRHLSSVQNLEVIARQQREGRRLRAA